MAGNLNSGLGYLITTVIQCVHSCFQDGGQDLCLRVEEVNSTWCFQKGADYLEVPFNHIWQAANPNLHCSFTFRSRDRGLGASKLSLTIGVSQKNSSKEPLFLVRNRQK